MSEIVLTKVDAELASLGFYYVRAIDDYTCFVGSKERAEEFPVALARELQKYRLQVNAKKTKIEEAPLFGEEWSLTIDSFMRKTLARQMFDYKDAKEALSMLAELAVNTGSYAPYKYFLTYLQRKRAGIKALTPAAVNLLGAHYYSMAFLHSYLLPCLDQCFFDPSSALFVDFEHWRNESDLRGLYTQYRSMKDNYGLSFLLSILIERRMRIPEIEATMSKDILDLGDPILSTLGYAYSRINSLPCLDAFVTAANELVTKQGLRGDQWLFAFEAGEYSVMASSPVCRPLEELKRKGYTFLVPLRTPVS